MNIDNPTLCGQALGEALRTLRRQACLTLDDAARVLGCSASRLSRVETGHCSPPIVDIAMLLGLYRADSTKRSYVLTLVRDADKSEWRQPKGQARAHWQDTLLTLESKAEQIVYFAPVVIPRLLQTHQYRSAVLAASATLLTSDVDEHAVSACCHAATPVAFVDEHVLRRPLGSREILRRQLGYLRETAADGRSTIRVVPSHWTVAGGAFTLVRLPDRSPVVVLEHLTCRLFLEHPSDIDAYEHALKHLDQNALDEIESMELISSIIDRLDM